MENVSLYVTLVHMVIPHKDRLNMPSSSVPSSLWTAKIPEEHILDAFGPETTWEPL